jgi:hypothetical protein
LSVSSRTSLTSAGLPFESSVVLPPGELARHLDRERNGVERAAVAAVNRLPPGAPSPSIARYFAA